MTLCLGGKSAGSIHHKGTKSQRKDKSGRRSRSLGSGVRSPGSRGAVESEVTVGAPGAILQRLSAAFAVTQFGGNKIGSECAVFQRKERRGYGPEILGVAGLCIF